ncbi:MAG: pyroglutamyl-peptidase I [Clostridia bacterium]|nr:pyroglutamyl-peptidase I [Clostridia bacterium]
MKRLLITGFEPFDKEVINPSWEAVKLLPDEINGYTLDKLLLPVVFGKAAETVTEAAGKLSPDVILCIGQAGGRRAITPELVGINLRHASIPDNAGYMPKDEPIIQGGESAHFSTLPARRMAEAIKASGIPSEVSYSAGAYVCNDVLYTLLSRFKGTDTRVGFIHIPYSSEQNKEPCMTMENIIKGLTVAVESIDCDLTK